MRGHLKTLFQGEIQMTTASRDMASETAPAEQRQASRRAPAKRINAKTIAYGLGWFSIGLGLAELVASRRIARGLNAEGHERLIKGFGLREIVAGLGLLQAPAHSLRMWSRVAGDGMDLAALGAAARSSPRNPV